MQDQDHYIYDLRRFGIVCYKQIHHQAYHYLFAWQICEIPSLLSRFDDEDREFIEAIAIEEHKDVWYKQAGQQLRELGYENFMKQLQLPA